MSSVVEIEQAIAKLSPQDFAEFAHWFDAERNRAWDCQIEEDARNGKLRGAYERLTKGAENQPPTPLHDFLGNEKLSS